VTDTGRARGRHALVGGGGIAGPTAAMALQRAGIEATVFEAYPADAAPAGALLTVAVNELTAYRFLLTSQTTAAYRTARPGTSRSRT
jgi:2-polyprenyl-6-methoxyphenol hydroxylase-like FAD-dependent oxidoreductase